MLRFASVALILLASSLASADAKLDAKRLADLEHTPLRAGGAAKDTAPATLDAKQLAADRVASATKLMESAQRRYNSGTATLADLERASLRVVDAALDGA